MNKESEVKIYETRDYSQFKKMLGNRDAKSENKIVESIKAVGLIPNPIIVNEKMEIIDGQNRLAALTQLEMPVYYIVVENLDIEACRRLNIGQTNWGLDDYIASYAKPSCNRVSDQLAYFEDAINRGKRKSTDKIFLSTDFQKRKYIER